MLEAFPDEITRFMLVDNQQGQASVGAHRWIDCRAFGETESRLIWCGKVTTWEDVEEKRIELGVEPRRTLVDTAFDGPDVQRQCIRYGWYGLRGDQTRKESFTHTRDEAVNGIVVKVSRQLPFSPPAKGIAVTTGNVRRQAIYFFWSQITIKNMWHRLKNGLAEYRWTVPQDVPEEYQKQTCVEFKKQQTSKDGKKRWEWICRKGAANHLTDCDQMSLVAALMDLRIQGILWSSKEETNKEETT